MLLPSEDSDLQKAWKWLTVVLFMMMFLFWLVYCGSVFPTFLKYIFFEFREYDFISGGFRFFCWGGIG